MDVWISLTFPTIGVSIRLDRAVKRSPIRARLIDRRNVGYVSAVFRRSEDEADCNAKEANQTNTGERCLTTYEYNAKETK